MVLLGGGADILPGERRFGKLVAEISIALVAVCDIRRLYCTASNPDLLILIVSAYCSGLRCSRFNLN
jgi:hypothetical protein